MSAIPHCDEALHDLSIMLHSDTLNPTFQDHLLTPDDFDYSIKSLESLERYLNEIRKDKEVEQEWNRTVLRCGAYVGEVIRLAKPQANWHWIDYATAHTMDPHNLLFKQQGIYNSAILTNKPASYCFPLGKVHKFLENGPEDSVKMFASIMIEMGLSDDGLCR